MVFGRKPLAQGVHWTRGGPGGLSLGNFGDPEGLQSLMLPLGLKQPRLSTVTPPPLSF